MTTYSAKSAAHRAARKAGHEPEAFKVEQGDDGRWFWTLLPQQEEASEGEAQGFGPGDLEDAEKAAAPMPQDAEGEGDDEQSMAAIQARNAARLAAAAPQAEEAPAEDEATEEGEDEEELTDEEAAAIADEAELAAIREAMGNETLFSAAEASEASEAEAAPVQAEAVAGLKAALLEGLKPAALLTLDESDPRMAEEYACTFSFPCTPALAQEIARIIARKADCPVVVGWEGDYPPGFTVEPGSRMSRQPQAQRQPREARPQGQGQRNARYEEALAAAQAGTLPQPPDFSADTHKSYRPKLAKLVAMAEASDLEGLRAYSITATNTSPTMMRRYRDLCIIALEARQGQAEAA